MEAVFFLLPIALLLSGAFLVLFLEAARAGQFDDLDDPAERVLWED